MLPKCSQDFSPRSCSSAEPLPWQRNRSNQPSGTVPHRCLRWMDLRSRISIETARSLRGLAVAGRGPHCGLGPANEPRRARGSYGSRLNGSAEFFAKQNNEAQAIAQASRLGIPVIISSDPRHHFEQALGASTQDRAFSMWPSTRRFADVVRQEYEPAGIRESLARQESATASRAIQCLQTENSLAEFHETDMRVQRLRNVPSHNCPT